MAFPTSPVQGQETTINGIVYTYSSSNNAWTRKPRQLFTSGVNAPANPAPGDQWYDTGEDILYQYINDGTGNYWVDIRSGIFGGNSASLGETLIQGNLIPTVNVTYSLGNITNQWKDLYVSSNTIYIGGTPVRISNGNLLVNNAPIIPAATYSNVEVAAYLKSSGGLSSATDAIILPAGTTAQRPTAANGMVRYNSTINGGSLEAYVGGTWVTIISGNYNIGFLIAAGGGGGGGRIGGGGGAGGVLTTGLNYTITLNSTYAVVVGGGGNAGPAGNGGTGGTGSNSSVFGFTALGGGGGAGTDGGTGGNGGSGGGGGRGGGGAGSATQTSSGIATGYGNAGGGSGVSSGGSADGSGGGGGAGAAGVSGGNSATASDGGTGIANPVPGSTVGQLVSSTYFVGGGGGGSVYSNPNGAGVGGNGGGASGQSGGGVGVAGTANTGGGGGGGGYSGEPGTAGGAGGSGVVIIYYTSATQRATGGSVTSYTSAGTTYWLHTYTSSGSFIT